MGYARTVEQYEQILSQDPTSPAFIALAKALIEAGEYTRAAEVCRQGLEHHPKSVVGRVLWGTTLIHLGKPAEAMAQFDQAVGLDRENPRVYQLIAGVLVRKSLYRSALPLLKKALGLRPDDERLKGWLEQTQQALAGGPAPDLADMTSEQLEALSAEHAVSSEPPREAPKPAPAHSPAAEESNRETTQVVRIPTANGAAAVEAAEDDPFAHVPRRTASSEEAAAEQTQIQNAPTGEADAAPGGGAAGTGAPSAAPGLHTDVAKTDVGAAVAAAKPAASAPATQPASGAPALATAPVASTGGNTRAPPPLGTTPPMPSSGFQILLADLPELPAPQSSVEVPKVEVSNEATRAIAQEYERELRAKLAAKASKKSFWQRHGGKLAIATIVLVALGVGVGMFLKVRARNRGQGLTEAIAQARTEIARDALGQASEALSRAVEMVDSSQEAWALTAYTHALLTAEAASPASRALAEKALTQPGVEENFPDLALVSRFHLAQGRETKAQLSEKILGHSLEGPRYALGVAAVHELAGRILLEKPKQVEEALARLDASFQAVPNVRALLALASYYREHSDLGAALDVYRKAAVLGRGHPGVVLGSAETKLQLGHEAGPLLTEVEALPGDDALAPPLAARRSLVRGRLLASSGRFDEALAVLTEGAQKWPGEGREFQLALGQTARYAGRYELAQKSLESVLKDKRTDEDALDELGRVLVAQDKQKEALRRLEVNASSRKVALVRGIAYVALEDWKKARAELARTQVGGKFPLEAVLYLALADAAEGEGAKALEVLERTLGTAKRHRGDIRVALGRVYWQRGALDKAREQFEEASKDPRDWEGKCALGRLLLSLGLEEKAVEPLRSSLTRNATHNEARHALVTALLESNRTEEARVEAEAGLKETPGAPDAERDLAHALFRLGRPADAEPHILQAAKKDRRDLLTARVESAVHFARGSSKLAFAALERANKIDPKSSETFCDIGHAFMRMGNRSQAEKAFGAAVRERPNALCGKVGALFVKLPSVSKAQTKTLKELLKQDAPPWDRAFTSATLARALLAAGQTGEARRAAEDAVAQAPYAGYAQLSLGYVAQRQKDEEAAKAAFARLKALDPTYAAGRLAYADLLARNEETVSEALAEYEVFLRLGAESQEKSRVERTVKTLKKKLAAR